MADRSPAWVDEVMAVVADVEWAEAGNAYGSGAHTPTALRAWLSQDRRTPQEVDQDDPVFRVVVDYPSATVSEAALAWMIVENFHQGSLYPASAPTCRAMVAALAFSPVESIQCDALNTVSHALGTADHRNDWQAENFERSSFESHLDTYDEIARGYELYLDAIGPDRSSEIRRHAARVLIRMLDRESSVERIIAVLEEHPGHDPETTAALLRTLGLLARGTTLAAQAEDLIRWFIDDPTDPGAEACLALVRLRRVDEDDRDVIDFLESALDAQGEFSDLTETLLDALVSVALHCAPRWDPERDPEASARRILVSHYHTDEPSPIDEGPLVSPGFKKNLARLNRLEAAARVRRIAEHHGLA